MSLIEFSHISKIYHKGFLNKEVHALSNVSFTIDKPCITGFVGPNGAGKTTSIKILLGMVRATSGTALLRGIPVSNPQAKHKVSYVSEQPYFYHYLTVKESLCFVYELLGLPKNQLQEQIQKALETVQLSGISNTKIIELSKGTQQRLTMAHALLGDPDIYIFDEPMSGLDPLGRKLFRAIFRELSSKNKCIFFSTHILDDIETLCDTVIVLSKGSLHLNTSLSKLIEQSIQGTDFTISQIPEQLQSVLRENTCEISLLRDGIYNVFLPKTADIKAFQTTLFQQGILPERIQPRRSSLESILYGSSV